MTNDLMLGGVYILMALMLVVGALISRREPAARLITMALAWIVIFGAGFYYLVRLVQRWVPEQADELHRVRRPARPLSAATR